MSSPITDFFEQHTTAFLGRHMTQTFWDAAPYETTFESAWILESSERPRLRKLAEKYVDQNECRPLAMGTECITNTGVYKGVLWGGYDQNHFIMSVLSAIVRLLGPKDKTARRAWRMMVAHTDAYLLSPNSWLSLESASYGTTGRLRIAGNAIRSLLDVAEAAAVMLDTPREQACRALIVRHLVNVNSKPMHDGPQGDGITLDHYRGFQVAFFLHAIAWLRTRTGIDTAPLGLWFLPIMERSVERDATGKVIGIWYDVPADEDLPHPWPGEKLNDGKGVEPWMHKFLPPDAQEFVAAANKDLFFAVKLKFGMTEA